jgi:hypothetical protein
MCFAPSLKSFYYRHAYACRSPVPMHSKLKVTPKLSFDKALGDLVPRHITRQSDFR